MISTRFLFRRKILMAQEIIMSELSNVLHACETEPLPSVLLLLTPAAKIRWADSDGFTALHYACKGNNLTVLNELLEKAPNKYKIDVNVRSETGMTPLHIACRYGHLSVVIYLLKVGADCAALTVDGETPLHLASFHGHGLVVMTLTWNTSVRIDAKDRFGYSPLYLACKNNHLDVAMRLLVHGADINQRNDSGLPLLGAFSKRPDTVLLLLRSGADICEMIDSNIYLSEPNKSCLCDILDLLFALETDIALASHFLNEVCEIMPNDVVIEMFLHGFRNRLKAYGFFELLQSKLLWLAAGVYQASEWYRFAEIFTCHHR